MFIAFTGGEGYKMRYLREKNIKNYLITGIILLLSFTSIVQAAVMPTYTRLQPITASMDAPTSVALDKYGCLLVAESINNRVLIYSQSGEYYAAITGLNKPISVAVDDSLKIYVGNKDTQNVEVYDDNLNFLYKLGSGDGEITQPGSIAIDDSGNIYVVDSEENVVKIYNPDGSYNTSFGSSGSEDGQFNFPTSIAIDKLLGEIIVTDLQITTDMFGGTIEGARVQVFYMSGAFKRSFGGYGIGDGLMGKPMGVTVDKESRIYVTDSQQHIVHVFDSPGTFLGTIYDTNIPMRTPLGITIGDSNRLFIASLNTGKVESFGISQYTFMSVTPLTLSYEGQESGSVASQNVTIQNNGTEIISWTATASNSWISLSETSGDISVAGDYSIGVGIDLTGLSAGSYAGNIVIRTQTGDTEVIYIDLTVVQLPVLSVTPLVLEFESVNGTFPAMQEVSIANTGGSTLNWIAVADSGWIGISQSSGTAPYALAVSADPSLKAAGTYTGVISITGENALSSPATISVTLNVADVTGTINVTSNLSDATFTINGSESFSGTGTSWTVTDAQTGVYTIIFGSVAGYNTPSAGSMSLEQNGTINFTGEYTAEEEEQAAVNKNIIVGAGPDKNNNGLVKVFNFEGVYTGVSFLSHGYGYGVNVTAGDINCDGVDEIITAPGPGPDSPSEINIFDANGNAMPAMHIDSFSYNYGTTIASADFDGDGHFEVLAGAGAGAENPAYVKVFVYDSANNKMIDSGVDLLAYDTGYGVKVAAGDVDNDGIPEIITVPGPGEYYKGNVKIWDIDTSLGAGNWIASLSNEFTIASAYGYSVNVASGDINGDGYNEIITGAGPHRKARDGVMVFDGTGGNITNFRSYIARYYGSTVASGDLDGDGVSEIIVGSGPGARNRATVKIFDANGVEQARFKAMKIRYGINIAVGNLGFE